MAKNNKIKCTSAADILGGAVPKRVSAARQETDLCFVCNKKMTTERMNALRSLKTPVNRWAHAKCSPTTKIKGVYTGEVGTSKLLLVDKLYNDSVRSVFRATENENRSESTDGHGDRDYEE
jgi:hypothetical protein